jgi:hypothetical protein
MFLVGGPVFRLSFQMAVGDVFFACPLCRICWRVWHFVCSLTGLGGGGWLGVTGCMLGVGGCGLNVGAGNRDGWVGWVCLVGGWGRGGSGVIQMKIPKALLAVFGTHPIGGPALMHHPIGEPAQENNLSVLVCTLPAPRSRNIHH